jgi:hypothetical protein
MNPMNVYEISLVKSYKVKIAAKNLEAAKELSAFFTGDIQDISEETDRKNHNFRILDIECTLNEAFEGDFAKQD